MSRDRKAAQAAAYREMLQRPTIEIATAGLILGVGINKAYECARDGTIPTIALGGKSVVPTAPLRRMLGLDTPEAA